MPNRYDRPIHNWLFPSPYEICLSDKKVSPPHGIIRFTNLFLSLVARVNVNTRYITLRAESWLGTSIWQLCVESLVANTKTLWISFLLYDWWQYLKMYNYFIIMEIASKRICMLLIIIHELPWIWGDLPIIFTSDEVTSEIHWQIASRVTQKSLFTVANASFYFLRTSLCPEHTIPLKRITNRWFRHCR